jgi:hypothetical protein
MPGLSGQLRALGEVPSRIYKTADETVNNSATYQDDDELSGIGLKAGTTYALRIALRHMGETTGDHKLRLALPAGAVWVTGGSFRTEAGSGAFNPSVGDASIAFTAEWRFEVLGAADQSVMDVSGFVIVGGTPGNLDVQWAQIIPTVADTKVLAGSYVELQEAA